MDPKYKHAFVVKIWLEHAEKEDQSEWRGRIDHVPSAKRFYFRSLNQILEFIQGYLKTEHRDNEPEASGSERGEIR